ncbi:MAG: ImmA/IrrE family metallo-endopeptidase [Elusimicrobiota bacterium]|jgi:Zn-dependent peptidase ImmA (M78 family)|nr:ImmA/IrrE family metallo-endopeptidase [Elusimicrobiota bacterium]
MNKEELLKFVDCSFNEKKSIDIVSLANTLGIAVYSEIMDSDESAFIVKDGEQFKIIVNENQNKERQRFSIAHEIAHFVLHKSHISDGSKIGRESIDSLDNEKEIEADDLAANIIMPVKYVDEYLETLKIEKKTFIKDEKIIKKIASNFAVSKPAIILRLRNLGYNVAYI